MTDTHALSLPFSWRDYKYPVLQRSVGFAHESVEHKFQYRDNEIIEQLGAHNLVFRYTLALRQNIAKGPYKNLFTEGLAQLFRDCRNRDPGLLVDPFYGEFRCTPNTFDDDSDVNKRDGTDVRVEFKYAPEETQDESENVTVTVQGVQSDANALDQEIKTVDWEQEPTPEPTTDPLSAVAGVVAQTDAEIGRVSAALDDVAYRCEKVEQAIDRIGNPEHFHFRNSTRRVRESAIRAKQNAQDPTKRIVAITTRYSQTLSDVAATLGVTIVDLLRINPSLASQPQVAAGTVVHVQR